MILFNASKKQRAPKLGQLWSCKVLLVLVLIFSVVSRASIRPSGAIVKHSQDKTTYFFNSTRQNPSYIIRSINGDSFVSIKNARDSYQYKIKAGIITDTTFEKHIRNFRIIASLHLNGSKYQLKKLIVTNKSVFFANGNCSVPRTSTLNSNVVEIAEISNDLDGDSTPAVQNNFIDASCKNLKPTDAAALDKLKDYFIQGDELNKTLSSCLNDPLAFEKISKLDKNLLHKNSAQLAAFKADFTNALALAAHSLEGRVEADKKKIAPITIGCEKTKNSQESNPANFDLSTFKINFFLKDQLDSGAKESLINVSATQHVFIHEFAHASLCQPSAFDAKTEDEIAEDIAKLCTSESDAGKGGSGLYGDHGGGIENPFSPQPSLADTKKVESQTAIQIATAVKEIPPQHIDPASLDYASDLPSTASASPAVNSNILESTMEAPMNQFAKFVDHVAAAIIPRAEAASSTTRSRNTDSSVAAASAPAVLASAAPISQKTIEQVYVPDPTSKDPVALAVTTTTGPSERLLSTVDQKTKKDSRSPASLEPKIEISKMASFQTTSIGNSVAASGANFAGSSFTQNLRQQAQNAESKPLVAYQIGGVTFTNKTLSGAAYRLFVSKLNSSDKTFKTELEKNGILITRNGSILTKPRNVELLYIDTGTSLMYGNMQ